MTKLILILTFLIVFLDAAYAEESNLVKGLNDRIEIYFANSIRYSQNEGVERIRTISSSYQGGFDANITEQSYFLDLIGLGLKYYPGNSLMYDVTFLTLPYSTAIGYTIPGSEKVFYRIMSFNSVTVTAKYIYKYRKNLDLHFGGGVAHNIVYTDPVGLGFNMLRNNYTTFILQAHANYQLNERLSLTFGFNYEFKDELDSEEIPPSVYTYKISPLSFQTGLSFSF